MTCVSNEGCLSVPMVSLETDRCLEEWVGERWVRTCYSKRSGDFSFDLEERSGNQRMNFKMLLERLFVLPWV